MRIFAYEYSSGGGADDDKLQNAMLQQGEALLHALICDFTALPDIEVITLRDPSRPVLDLPESTVVVPCHGSFEECFDSCLQAADAVWLVAPEAGGVLERLSWIVRRKRILLGSRPDAVHIASSRLRMMRALQQAGIPTVDTYLPDDVLPSNIDGWVVKPDDGLSYLHTRLFLEQQRALDWIQSHDAKDYVLQPYVHGKSCSLSMLCCDGDAQILSCNEQRIAVRGEQFHCLGCSVNSVTDSTGEYGRLAREIAKAIPGLWGYVGVEFMMTCKGPIVLRVSPRLTMPYIGLHASIGRNPAGLVLSLLDGPMNTALSALDKVAVSIDLDSFGSHTNPRGEYAKIISCY